MTDSTPIALFVYNRPGHADRALRALSQCARFDECRLHIFCDGPLNPDVEAAVAETRRVVRAWAARLDRRVQVVEQAGNLGLARSVVAGVSAKCADHGRVIVVEDDLVVGPAFLDYMLRSLDRYQGEPAVYQIAGYMPPIRQPRKPDAFFLPFVNFWGWATWQRAWQIFDWEAPGAREQMADPAVRQQFDLDDGRARFSRMLLDRLAGQNDSWGILWRYAVFKRAGLVLHPRRSFVWNGGIDGTGRHAGRVPKFPEPAPADVANAAVTDDWQWPAAVVGDEAALKRLKGFERTRGQTWRSRVVRGLRRRLSRFTPGPGR